MLSSPSAFGKDIPSQALKNFFQNCEKVLANFFALWLHVSGRTEPGGIETYAHIQSIGPLKPYSACGDVAGACSTAAKRAFFAPGKALLAFISSPSNTAGPDGPYA